MNSREKKMLEMLVKMKKGESLFFAALRHEFMAILTAGAFLSLAIACSLYFRLGKNFDIVTGILVVNFLRSLLGVNDSIANLKSISKYVKWEKIRT